MQMNCITSRRTRYGAASHGSGDPTGDSRVAGAGRDGLGRRGAQRGERHRHRPPARRGRPVGAGEPFGPERPGAEGHADRHRVPDDPAGPGDELFVAEPAEHLADHPGPGVQRRRHRPVQRWPRTGRRLLCGSGLSRAPGDRGVRLPGHRAGRGAARAAGHRLRQEHHRRRRQPDHQGAQLQARGRGRGVAGRLQLPSGPGHGDRADLRRRGGRAIVGAGDPPRRRDPQRDHGGRPEHGQQPGGPRPAPDPAKRQAAHPPDPGRQQDRHRLLHAGLCPGRDLAEDGGPPISRPGGRPVLQAAQPRSL